jgi:hypothetical protein
MQRFVAELSAAIGQAAFERSWHTEEALNGKHPKVEFAFDHRRVPAIINSDPSERWVSTSFYRIFSAAVRCMIATLQYPVGFESDPEHLCLA